ncbi:DNA-binding transcriptional regulator, LysR family [Pseudomonas sp. NFACC02]|uniref:LysR substrate-binding domain-containing protein n=1 Tax=Pseudomonas sp. NFACC02 TaxID=1566250 RepID=UPI0008C4C30D|nr:LysR substrate-binding domain-containing protein [Pseudomonas sp. NFACC02]SEQ17720.1 DNA-binding transcriptional regulator, LysR family [Pseudomonas sp. NFACC02]
MDRYHEMVIFRGLQGCRSLSMSADRAGVAVTTLVRAIDRLESRLKARLIIRTTQGIAFTAAGERFLADAIRILDEVERSESSARGMPSVVEGRLNVIVPELFSSYVYPEIISEYSRQHPEVTVFTRFSDQYPAILEDGIDIALHVGSLPSSTLIARQVGHVKTHVCGSPSYLGSYGEPQIPAQLRTHRLIATQGHCEDIHWVFQFAGQPLSFKATSQLRCATAQAAINASCQGAGLLSGPSFALHSYLDTGKLQRTLGSFELPAAPIHLVYREGRRASLRVRSFVDYTVSALRAHPALQLVAN